MTGPVPRPRRIVVCGTRFGQIYLAALARAPERYRLAGIVARGGARSTALAQEYDVPLYTRVEDLPRDIDAACVVVSGGVGGGPGAELAQALLERGIPVLQEHPVHPRELADCLRVARRTGTAYQVNTFYPHLEPVRRFIGAARELVRLRRPVFVDALCAVQVSFDLLDILARIFDGLGPWSWSPPAPGGGRPLVGVDGQIAGVPLTLRVENRMQSGDDSSSLLLHRITVGTDAGNLMLANSHGPVLWSPVLNAPPPTGGRLFPRGENAGALWPAGLGATADYVGPAQAPTWSTAVDEVWSQGVLAALDELSARVDAGTDVLQGSQRPLAVARAWQQLTELLGFPEVSHPDPQQPLTAADLGVGEPVAAGGGPGGRTSLQ
ncbi:Gfo/Idh/MocA family oxidoreductase [Streptomyces sp. NPDC087440]|uniref:Gfo/Idh/MocA family oxidoreductase n=1 Tax=Streptomyces sp. NPDC087440 TaxID=3365790 RepID=UPI00382E6462